MIAFYRAWLSIRQLEVPTIAAVNGPAIGAGLCLALACDLRYAAAGARLGVPFVKLGMHAGMAGTYLLPNVVGEAHARDLLLTGRVVDADEALRLGLVSRVIEPAAFLDEVLATAAGHRRHRADRRAGSPSSRCATAGTPTSSRCLQWEALAQPITLATADLQEGIRAAQEKRRRLHRCFSRRAELGREREEAPCPSRGHLPSPCECPVDGPGASSGGTR